MGREVGGGFMFGNACTPVVDSCQCMAKLAFKKYFFLSFIYIEYFFSIYIMIF